MLILAFCGICFFLGVILRERHPLDTFAVRLGSSFRPIMAPAVVGACMSALVMAVPCLAEVSAQWLPIALVSGWILDTLLHDLTWTTQEGESTRVIDLRRHDTSHARSAFLSNVHMGHSAVFV